MDNNGRWQNAENVSVTPDLSQPPDIYIQPHFIEYLILFQPVATREIRIVGDAALVDHWHSFTNRVSGLLPLQN